MVKKERRTWDHWALPEGLALGRRGRAGAAVSVVAKVQETWLEKLSMAATGDRFVSKFPKVDSLAPCRMRSMSRLAPWTTEMIWGEGKDGQGHNNHKKNIKELIFLIFQGKCDSREYSNDFGGFILMKADSLRGKDPKCKQLSQAELFCNVRSGPKNVFYQNYSIERFTTISKGMLSCPFGWYLLGSNYSICSSAPVQV